MDKTSLSFLLNTISFWTVTIMVILYAILLIVITTLAPDLEFIKAKSFYFIIELFAVPTFTCIPLIFFTYYRNLSFKNSLIFILSFWVKILILHLLFEVSGFYNWLIYQIQPPKS
jgi:hypothetical protein